LQPKTIFELLHESAKAITSELELEKVVQRVTDIGTELAGAQFGAFFYNVINQKGESYILYTISGVPKEHFSKFPMPRNTKIFEPTFTARGTVRYDDVTQQPHFGQNAPYYGMPKGHLPVKSYLAVPVVSPVNGEAIGGLFFGHSDIGVFKEEAEKLIEGVATQAAIAITNARLFEEKKRTEESLIEQREQYRSIFNATSESMIIYDENGHIAEVNPAACQIFGYGHNEMIGKHASLLFKDPQDFEALKEIALSGRTYSGVHTRKKKNGVLFDVQFRGTFFIYRGKPHVLSVVREITAEEKIKHALEKSEELSNIITSVSPVVLWMTNEKAETIYMNQTWTDWVGGTSNEYMGLAWSNVIVEEDRENLMLVFQTAFSQRKVFNYDVRIRRRSGDIRWVAVYGTPYYNKEGSFSGFAGSLTDITERKEAEDKLESQNVLINTITNNTQQALFFMNDKQRCTYMNPAAEQITGFKLHEIQDKPLHDYIHHTHPDGRHFPIEECPIDRALPTESQTQGETVFISKEGRFFPVAFIASPIVENGIPKGTVIEVRDTSDEKKIQEALRNKEKQAMEMLEQKVKERTSELEKTNYELLQFTSVASHDLKEPVRKISVFSGMIKQRLDLSSNPSVERYLDNITDSSKRMASLIDDLLAYSRLSHENVVFEKVDLNTLLERIVDDLEIPIKEKDATIHFKHLPLIHGIPLQLGQVFQNLLSNSLKFAYPGRPPVISILSEEISKKSKKCFKITYTDNGIGFKPEQAERIFDVFFRLHSKDQYEGTGVGLAIVKKIIAVHNGSITASGVENGGARFEIFLPEVP
jgi:PAS domain S-box-containing protein